MFSLFRHRESVIESGLLSGAVDNHCHILYGVDDGVRTEEESLSILKWLEELGLTEVWFTPHIMEDVPNTTAGLTARFDALKAAYHGPLQFHLAAEYMMDNLFEERLSQRDLLFHGEDTVLVETSTIAPPIDFWELLERMMTMGYRPLLAHPERYRYMVKEDYRRLHEMGVMLQMNLPSIVGFYGETARLKAEDLLAKGWYAMVGSDCHRFRVVRKQYETQALKKETVRRLQPLMAVSEIY